MVDAANRYSNLDLLIPRTLHDQLTAYVSRSDKDGKPFARQVDAWWCALTLGVHMGQRHPLPHADQNVKFNTASILSTDPWRITHLELLALSEEGQEALQNPGHVIHIASEYAHAGFPWLLEQLLGESEPTLALMNRLPQP